MSLVRPKSSPLRLKPDQYDSLRRDGWRCQFCVSQLRCTAAWQALRTIRSGFSPNPRPSDFESPYGEPKVGHRTGALGSGVRVYAYPQPWRGTGRLSYALEYFWGRWAVRSYS